MADKNKSGMAMNPEDDAQKHKGIANDIPSEDDHAQIREDNLVNPDGSRYEGPRTQQDADQVEVARREAEQKRQDKLRQGK